VLRRWGSDTRKFGLSTEPTMQIDHRTEIEKLTLRALALRQSVRPLPSALMKGQRSKRQPPNLCTVANPHYQLG